jgi:hypothetical protein
MKGQKGFTGFSGSATGHSTQTPTSIGVLTMLPPLKHIPQMLPTNKVAGAPLCRLVDQRVLLACGTQPALCLSKVREITVQPGEERLIFISVKRVLFYLRWNS